MTASTAVLRTLRKPALALVAAAGLVAWGGAASGQALLAGPPPIVPGQATLTAGGHVEAAVLGSAGFTTSLLAEAGQRPQARGGADRDPRHPRPASPAHGHRVPAGVDGAGADERVRALLAQRRAGHETAPATGPPSLPF